LVFISKPCVAFLFDLSIAKIIYILVQISYFFVYNIYAGTAPWSKHFLLNAIMYAFVNIIRLIAKTTFAYSLGMYTLYIYKLMEDNNH